MDLLKLKRFTMPGAVDWRKGIATFEDAAGQEWAVATNSYIFVAQLTESPYPDYLRLSSEMKWYPGCEWLLNTSFAGLEVPIQDFKKWAGHPLWSKTCTCPTCAGTGRRMCPHCEQNMTCDHCDGQKRVSIDPKPREVTISGVPADANFIARALTLFDTAHVTVCTPLWRKYNMVVLLAEGCRVAIAPRTRGTAKVPEFNDFIAESKAA